MLAAAKIANTARIRPVTGLIVAVRALRSWHCKFEQMVADTRLVLVYLEIGTQRT